MDQNRFNLDVVQNSMAMAFRLFRGLVWPYHFAVVEDLPAIISVNVDTILGFFIVIAVLLMLYVGLRQKKQWVAAMLWLSIPLVLVVSPWPRGAVYQDRYTFLPSIGLTLALAFILQWMAKKISRKDQIALWTLVGVWAFSFVPVTLARNLDWRNDVALWCREARVFPSSFQAQKSCGWALREIGALKKSLFYYTRAIAIKKESRTINDYAVVLARLERCDRALPIFRKLYEKDPSLDQARQNEALCLKQLEELKKEKS